MESNICRVILRAWGRNASVQRRLQVRQSGVMRRPVSVAVRGLRCYQAPG